MAVQHDPVQPRVPRALHVALLLLVAIGVPGLGGCAVGVGARNIPGDSFDYAGSIRRSWKEQMLLNMVAMRYLDPPMVLDVQQVVQQYTLETSGSVFAPNWSGNSNDAPSAGAAVRYHGHWFWVDDRDVPSKRGLSFLMMMFTMVQSGSSIPPPTLTISRP